MACVQNVARLGVHFAYLYAQKLLTFSSLYQGIQTTRKRIYVFHHDYSGQATNIELALITEDNKN